MQFLLQAMLSDLPCCLILFCLYGSRHQDVCFVVALEVVAYVMRLQPSTAVSAVSSPPVDVVAIEWKG